MTRDRYLDKCTRAAIKLGRFFRFSDVPWSDGELVTYRQIRYIPSKLIISFDRNGTVKYSAELKDKRCESVTIAKLNEVNEVET